MSSGGVQPVLLSGEGRNGIGTRTRRPEDGNGRETHRMCNASGWNLQDEVSIT